jgi:taurine dioxygenase
MPRGVLWDASASLEIHREATALGATITGVDLAGPLDEAAFRRLRQALLDHLVIVFPDQGHLTPEQQIAFARRWGTLEPHPYVPPIEGHPEIMRVYDPTPLTATWHADFTYAPRPPAISILLARVVPPIGGDTMFSNAYLAYERLTPGYRAMLEGLRALHEATEMGFRSGLPVEQLRSVHPVICKHPETGRKVVFVNADYTRCIDGWSAAESRGVLEYLYARFAEPELTFRHRWKPGDLLIWDNRCTQHRVVADTGGADRTLHRVTIAGSAPS